MNCSPIMLDPLAALKRLRACMIRTYPEKYWQGSGRQSRCVHLAPHLATFSTRLSLSSVANKPILLPQTISNIGRE